MITDIMNIYAPAGSKVVFAYPNNGYPCDVEDAKRAGLEAGSTYTVLRTSVASSSSTVVLEEFPNNRFNTVLFADADQPITDTDRLDWLERNLMHLSHARCTSSVYMDGKAVSGQLVNGARGPEGGPGYFRIHHKTIREGIDAAINWKKNLL